MHIRVKLDDDLLRRAKAAAAEAGVPLSRLIEDSLREMLRHLSISDPVRSTRFRMVTFGGGERRVAHRPADFADAAEAEDLESLHR